MDVFPEPDPRRLGEGGQVVKVMESVPSIVLKFLPFWRPEFMAPCQREMLGTAGDEVGSSPPDGESW